MNAQMLEWGAHILALAFLAGTLACALAATMSRSLFAMCMSLASAHACAAVAVMAFGSGDTALTLAVYGAGLSPVLILAGLLLSARAAKAFSRGPVWLAAITASAAGAAMLWSAPELSAAAAPEQTTDAIALWLAVLLFVAATGCVGLLGHGERGSFDPPGARRKE